MLGYLYLNKVGKRKNSSFAGEIDHNIISLKNHLISNFEDVFFNKYILFDPILKEEKTIFAIQDKILVPQM